MEQRSASSAGAEERPREEGQGDAACVSIFVYGGPVATVDKVDLTLAFLNWRMDKYGYARTKIGDKHPRLHQLVAERMGIVGQADHKDRDKLNNRRSNLRPATTADNNNNRGMPNKTGYRGVSWQHNKWRAKIKYDGKCIQIGRFDNIIDAAKAYDTAAKQYYGEFALLNFPEVT